MTWFLSLLLAVVLYEIYEVVDALEEIHREEVELKAIRENVAAIKEQLREVTDALGANDAESSERTGRL